MCLHVGRSSTASDCVCVSCWSEGGSGRKTDQLLQMVSQACRTVLIGCTQAPLYLHYLVMGEGGREGGRGGGRGEGGRGGGEGGREGGGKEGGKEG